MKIFEGSNSEISSSTPTDLVGILAGQGGFVVVVNSIDYLNFRLLDSFLENSLNWDSRVLFDADAQQSVDWDTRDLYDSTGIFPSLNWTDRQLKTDAGLTILDWSTDVSFINSLTALGFGGGGSGIVSVATYAALRADANNSNVIFLRHQDYGGIFVRDNSSSRIEDGCLTIIRSNGDKYHRLWDKQHFNVDWLNVGDLGGDGTNAATTLVDPAQKFSLGAMLVGDGGVLVARPGATYLFGRSAILQKAVDLDLRGAKIKRADAVSTTVAVQANSGSTSIQLTNVSGFRVGDSFAYVSGVASSQANSFAGGGKFEIITGIVGNTISFANALSANATVGMTIVRIANLFYYNSSAASGGRPVVNIRGGHFDGNRTSNNLTAAWEMNYTLSSTVPVLIDGGAYYTDMPCENINGVPNGSTIKDAKFLNLYGSLIHYSDSSGLPGSNAKINLIENVEGTGVCLESITNSGHNEGMATRSVNTNLIRVVNCRIKNCGGEIVGATDVNDQRLVIENSEFEDFAAISKSQFSTDYSFIGVQITGNRFKNCGDLLFRGDDIYRNEGFDSIVVSRNRFYGNTRFLFEDVADVDFEDNTIIYEEGLSYSTTPSGGVIGTAFDSGAVTFHRFDRVRCRNNTIELPKAYNSALDFGILMYHPPSILVRRKNSGGTNLDVAYPQGIRVNGNTVKNARKGIGVQFANVASQYLFPFADWEMDDNTVTSPPDTTHTPNNTLGWGIECPPGCFSRRSTIIYQSGYINSNYWPYIAQGLHSTSTVLAKSLGAMVDGVTIIGNTGAFNRNFSIGWSSGTTNTRNCVARNIRSTSVYAVNLFDSTSAIYGERAIDEAPSGAINGSNTAFTLAQVPDSSQIQVFVNGILRIPTTDYSLNQVTRVVTMTWAPASGSIVRVVYTPAITPLSSAVLSSYSAPDGFVLHNKFENSGQY